MLDLIQSSLQKGEDLKNFAPQNNGFMHAIVLAYNDHHNLVIRKSTFTKISEHENLTSYKFRPDDVWIAILSQFYL